MLFTLLQNFEVCKLKVIISPAKKMRVVFDENKTLSLPVFYKEAEFLAKKIKKLSLDEIETIMKVNPKIAMDTFIYYNDFFDFKHEIPAILSYCGLQYTHIKAEEFKDSDFSFINDTVRILSGLYGILKPYDGICPYRLEMQCKLDINGKNLYKYWSDKIYKELYKEDDIVINLASNEYAKVIKPYLKDKNKFITVDFKTVRKGKIRTIATEAKALRGEMVKYIVKNNIDKAQDLKDFVYEGYKYIKENSYDNNFIFMKV